MTPIVAALFSSVISDSSGDWLSLPVPFQPEVVGSLTGLTELLCDFNKIGSLPSLLGNLTRLQHLDASNNKISHLAEEIGCCTQLVYLQLSANNLRVGI